MKFVLLWFSVAAISSAMAVSEKSDSNFKTMFLKQLEVKLTFDAERYQSASSDFVAFILSAFQIVNVDGNGKIVGVITTSFDVKDELVSWSSTAQPVMSFTIPNATYLYTGKPLDYASGKASAKGWNAVLYVWGEVFGDDNDLYYGYAPNLMPYHKSEAGWPSGKKSDTSTIYYKGPFVIVKLEVQHFEASGSKNMIFQHIKNPDKNQMFLNSDWIANHGIYRFLDTTSIAGKSGEDIMHNLYYPVVQHVGSYLT